MVSRIALTVILIVGCLFCWARVLHAENRSFDRSATDRRSAVVQHNPDF